MSLCIDVSEGGLIPLVEAARRLPGRPSLPTLWRWCSHGVRGTRLAHVRVGRRLFTSLPALNEFAHACASSSAERREAAKVAAERTLNAAVVSTNHSRRTEP